MVGKKLACIVYIRSMGVHIDEFFLRFLLSIQASLLDISKKSVSVERVGIFLEGMERLDHAMCA